MPQREQGSSPAPLPELSQRFPGVTCLPSSLPGRCKLLSQGHSSLKHTRGRGTGSHHQRCLRGRSCCSCQNRAKHQRLHPGAGTPTGTGGLTLGIPGSCPARITTQAEPSLGSQGSPCWQRGHGWRQPSPWNPGAQGSLQRVPFQPGWQARQKPSTGEQGWLRLQLPQLRGQRGTEVTKPTLVPLKSRFHPTESRFYPTQSLSIILGQGEIHRGA